MQTEIWVIFSPCCNTLNMKKINKIRKPNYHNVVNLPSTDCPSVWFSSLFFPRNFCSPSGVWFFLLSFPTAKQHNISYTGGVSPTKITNHYFPCPSCPTLLTTLTYIKKGGKLYLRETVSDLSIASRKENRMLGLCQPYCLGATFAMKAHTTIIAAKKVSLFNIVKTFSQILPISGQLPFSTVSGF